jgi:alpha-glucosidase (family GH31 glycosyl hydrolase)
MATLASLGYRVMAWTSPYLEKPGGSATPDPAQVLYAQADAAHDFVEDGEGNDYAPLASPIKGGAGILDFTNAGAQAFWEQQVAQATRAGIHGFKCDYGEDLVPDLLGARDPVAFADGTTSRTARLFPIEEHATYHAVLDEAFPGDGALIVRASSWGGASQADVIWPGDLDPRFEHQGDTLAADEGTGLAVGGLPAVVVDAQTLSVSGFRRSAPTRRATGTSRRASRRSDGWSTRRSRSSCRCTRTERACRGSTTTRRARSTARWRRSTRPSSPTTRPS